VPAITLHCAITIRTTDSQSLIFLISTLQLYQRDHHCKEVRHHPDSSNPQQLIMRLFNSAALLILTAQPVASASAIFGIRDLPFWNRNGNNSSKSTKSPRGGSSVFQLKQMDDGDADDATAANADVTYGPLLEDFRASVQKILSSECRAEMYQLLETVEANVTQELQNRQDTAMDKLVDSFSEVEAVDSASAIDVFAADLSTMETSSELEAPPKEMESPPTIASPLKNIPPEPSLLSKDETTFKSVLEEENDVDFIVGDTDEEEESVLQRLAFGFPSFRSKKKRQDKGVTVIAAEDSVANAPETVSEKPAVEDLKSALKEQEDEIDFIVEDSSGEEESILQKLAAGIFGKKTRDEVNYVENEEDLSATISTDILSLDQSELETQLGNSKTSALDQVESSSDDVPVNDEAVKLTKKQKKKHHWYKKKQIQLVEDLPEADLGEKSQELEQELLSLEREWENGNESDEDSMVEEKSGQVLAMAEQQRNILIKEVIRTLLKTAFMTICLTISYLIVAIVGQVIARILQQPKKA
jgi:hypothetical protein